MGVSVAVAVAARSQWGAPARGKCVCVWSSFAGMLTLMKASEVTDWKRFRLGDDTSNEKAVCAGLCVCVWKEKIYIYIYINVVVVDACLLPSYVRSHVSVLLFLFLLDLFHIVSTVISHFQVLAT